MSNDYTTPQVATISDKLIAAKQDTSNSGYHIRDAQNELTGLDAYVRGLEDSNAMYVSQITRLRDEVAKLRRRAA